MGVHQKVIISIVKHFIRLKMQCIIRFWNEFSACLNEVYNTASMCMFHLIQGDGWKNYVRIKLCELAEVQSLMEMTENHKLEIIDKVRASPVDLIPNYFTLKALRDRDILYISTSKSKGLHYLCDNYGMINKCTLINQRLL